MRIGAVVVVIWIIIGAIAAGQRGYFSSDPSNCAKAGNTVLTVIAGPLNYMGLNPKLSCELPEPAK